jgi:uridine kinase
MERQVDIIQNETKRPTVEVHFPDGKVFSGPRGVPVEAFVQAVSEIDDDPIVGAVINGELRELTYPIDMDAVVRFVKTSEADGARIYRRSLTFLLEAAFDDMYPTATLVVDHSVASGGYYCHVTGRPPLDEVELETLHDHMISLVEADLPFEKRKVPLDEAIEFFEQKGEMDKVALMRYRQKDHLILYRLGDHQDYHHGYMVPSTGHLKWFDLAPMGEGFVLRFPRRHASTELLPLPESPKLIATFRQYGHWLSRMGIGSVSALNDAILSSRVREIILVSEALHEQKIAEMASQITALSKQARIILIAGPSSSGKTTFAKRLTVQMLARGLSPFAIELDNYFVDRAKTPRDSEGQYDYESIGALNTILLSDHLRQLIDGQEIMMPHYNFKTGQSEPGEVVRLQKDQLIILEGIHGLNPHLIPDLPSEQTFRLYVSCLTQLNLDSQNRISTTDTRLLRRIVRDARERGYSAQQTIRRWESVRRGEKRWIFPFQNNADEMFNSALVYEVSSLKLLVEPLLRQVPYGTPEHIEAKRLLAFLEWFLPLDPDLIPDNSILREFTGGSILREFKVWDSPSRVLET